jgi:eukaryotic-like serine/threonine-protein kinase
MASSLDRGVTLAHYRVLSALGAGGMGEVYEARDERLDRAVALKVLPQEFVQNEERVRRFILEAKSASGLNHPHIVTIYDIGQADPGQQDAATPATAGKPVHYIAMELVRGLTLRDKIHGDKASLKELIRWLAQIAEGMAKAHAAGIVHRDLKPENVMISNDGFAKILDFGLAKLTEGKASIEGGGSMTAVRNTHQGAVMGTVGYMSPEQVQGRVVDARSDIFSFGCMLYEATTRQRAFEADSQIETMHQIINAAPVPVAELNPDTPAELRKMIRRCLAKDPEKRYQSMKDLSLELFDMVEEFDELSTSTPSRSSSGSGSVGAIAPPRRSWTLITTVVLLLAALVVVSTLLLRQQAPSATPGVKATFTQLTDFSGPESQPALSPDGQYLAYVARPSPETNDRDIFLLRVGGRNPINLTAGTPEVDEQPAFSPDGQSIAFRSGRGGGGIFVMGATGESVRRISDFGFNPSWSPDGKKVVVSTETGNNPRARTTVATLWVIDVQSRQKTKIYEGDAVGPRWSPHGQRIAFWGLPTRELGQRDIMTIAAEGGKALLVTDDPPLDWSPAWAPDGKSLYFASDRGGSMNIWRVPIDESTGEVRGALAAVTTPSAWSGDLAIAQNVGRIAYAASNTQLNIHRITIDPTTLQAQGGDVPVTSGSTQFVEPSISPDGSTIVMRTSAGQEDLYIVKPDGSGLRKITDDPAKDRNPTWSPDGTRIVFYSDRSGRYELWSIDVEGSDLQQITNTSGRTVWFPEWSPDGKKILTFNEISSFVFDVSGVLPIAESETLPPIEKDVSFGASSWSPDGKWLAGLAMRDGVQTPGFWIYSIDSKSYTKVAELGDGSFNRPAWTPDGRHIIVSSGGGLFAVDPATREVKKIFRPAGYGASQPSITRDGRMIYFSTDREEGDIWMATIDEPPPVGSRAAPP